MQLLSKLNKEIRFLFCVIDVYSKYAELLPLKDKKTHDNYYCFSKFLDGSGRKASKIWVEKGSEFYNRSMKSWLEDYGIEMYSTHNEGP